MPETGATPTVASSAGPMGGIRRPRPPRLICPPLRPAARASSGVHSCAVPFSCAARPPLLAISRCFSATSRQIHGVLFVRPQHSSLIANPARGGLQAASAGFKTCAVDVQHCAHDARNHSRFNYLEADRTRCRTRPRAWSRTLQSRLRSESTSNNDQAGSMRELHCKRNETSLKRVTIAVWMKNVRPHPPSPSRPATRVAARCTA